MNTHHVSHFTFHANLKSKIQSLPSNAVKGSKSKVRGQTTVIIGLCMLVLIAIVGLAVDGGSMYAQRRSAQNAADGAALAGARNMLNYYETMARNNYEDIDGSSFHEDAIRYSISQYAAMNGVLTNTLQAYFVDTNKQLVTVADGEGGCGEEGNPCQIGKNGSIPWTLGARGVVVTNRAQTGAFFFKIFGWNQVGATASATAYMGVAVDNGPDIAVMPVGFFTSNGIANFEPGQTYVLMAGSSEDDEGRWANVDYNAYADSSKRDAWFTCGYKPSLASTSDWSQWCNDIDYKYSQASGPTQYWTGDTGPYNGPYYAPRLQWGAGETGWWLGGETVTAQNDCDQLSSIVNALDGATVLLPIFDTWDTTDGKTTMHLLTLAWFRIENSWVDCHVPGPGIDEEHAEWHIEGVFRQKVASGSSGTHGDMRHNSLHVVFLEH